MKIEVLHHATIKILADKIIYFDPYDIKEEYHDADYIFITHDHYDHYNEESIQKILKNDTKIIVPRCLSKNNNYLVVDVNKTYDLDDLEFETIPSYNQKKISIQKKKNMLAIIF